MFVDVVVFESCEFCAVSPFFNCCCCWWLLWSLSFLSQLSISLLLWVWRSGSLTSPSARVVLLGDRKFGAMLVTWPFPTPFTAHASPDIPIIEWSIDNVIEAGIETGRWLICAGSSTSEWLATSLTCLDVAISFSGRCAFSTVAYDLKEHVKIVSYLPDTISK